ncbi:MAG: prolipoprotein diacylglyceryl transferase [Mycobacterium sp.]
MTTTTLAYFPSPAQGVWHLGPVPIRAYAVCIIVGIIAALLVGDRRWVARGGERGVIYDIALWAVPFGLIGGRLYHVMTDWRTYFGPGGAGPMAALRIWDGGLGIWGAVALGGVGAWIACRRRGIPLPAFGDAIAPGIILAQAIGRVGNYFNQELYGRETTVPWGMQIFYRQDPSGIIDVHSLNGVSTGQVAAVVHPTFLYELLWNLLVFVVLLLVDRRFKMGHGRLFALYVALYCVGRFVVELLRDDTATHIAGIRINSFTSTFVFLGAVVYLILAKKGREDPSSLGGRHDADEFDDEPELAPALAAELAAVAAGTGVVAAATVAGAEDEEAADPDAAGDADDASEEAEDFDLEDSGALDVTARDEDADLDLLDSADESESVDEFEALDDSGASEAEDEFAAEDFVGEDADDVEPDAEDEAVVETEVIAPGVEVESADDAEDDVIDEDHDPISEEELEGLSDDVAVAAPVSEQEELLEDEVADEDDAAAEADSADPSTVIEDASDEAADTGTDTAEAAYETPAEADAEDPEESVTEADDVAESQDAPEPEGAAESVTEAEDTPEPEDAPEAAPEDAPVPEDAAEPAGEVEGAEESVTEAEDTPEPEVAPDADAEPEAEQPEPEVEQTEEPVAPRRRGLFRRRR